MDQPTERYTIKATAEVPVAMPLAKFLADVAAHDAKQPDVTILEPGRYAVVVSVEPIP